MIDEKFVILGVAISIVGNISYVWHTLKGRTRPNRVTWLLWALAPLIAFSAELSQGVGLRSLVTFISGFDPLLVFIASFFNKRAYWRVSRLDIACGGLSVAALLLWGVAGAGNMAIALSIATDLLAAVPTLVKAYVAPHTEHPNVYRNGAIDAVIALLTIKTWTMAEAGFPLYLFLLCSALYVLVRFKIGKRIMAEEPILDAYAE